MKTNLDKTFSALADPTRRALLMHLSQGEKSVSDLAEPFLKEMSLPAITKHLKVLETAGLITKTRNAQWRPCKLNGEPLKEASSWIDQYRNYWEDSFDRLEAYLKTMKNSTTDPATAPLQDKYLPPNHAKPKRKKGKRE